jgi:hypothetical protein
MAQKVLITGGLGFIGLTLARTFDVLANDRHGITKLVLASSRSVYGEGAYHRLGDIRHNYADMSAIGQPLAFSPKVPLDEGMAPRQSGVDRTRPDEGLSRC